YIVHTSNFRIRPRPYSASGRMELQVGYPSARAAVGAAVSVPPYRCRRGRQAGREQGLGLVVPIPLLETPATWQLKNPSLSPGILLLRGRGSTVAQNGAGGA